MHYINKGTTACTNFDKVYNLILSIRFNYARKLGGKKNFVLRSRRKSKTLYYAGGIYGSRIAQRDEKKGERVETLRIPIAIKTFLGRCRRINSRETNLREKLDFSRSANQRDTRRYSSLVLDFSSSSSPILRCLGSLTCSRRSTEDTMFTELFGLSPWSRALALSLLPPSSFLSLVREGA